MRAGRGRPRGFRVSDLLPLYEQLAADLKQLHAQVMQGKHVFGEERDLPCMPLVNKWKERLPFYNLFETLNVAQKHGI